MTSTLNQALACIGMRLGGVSAPTRRKASDFDIEQVLLDAAEDRSKNIGRYHAGILCICVAGCLMVFKLSPWWLYFNELVPESDFFPFGVYFFALASLIHGYKLVFYSTPSGSTNIPIPETASPISMKKKQQKMSLNSKKKKFIQVKPSFTNGVLCFLSSLPSDG